MSVKIVNNMPKFSTKSKLVLADALKEGARDILVKAKNKAPFDTGGLRSDTAITRPGVLTYRVSFLKEYARYQHAGGDGKRRVRNYTTPGTGKNYLKQPGDEVAANLSRTFKKHASRVRV